MLLILSFITLSARAAKDYPTEPVYRDIQQGSPEDKEAFYAVVKNFELYSSLFADVYQENNYLVPIHGESLKDLLHFLSAGFEQELASDIVEAFLQWHPELGKMVIIPCDGIPVLTAGDMDKTVYYRNNDKHIFFKRYYENCYAEGDKYVFTVSACRSDELWKIYALELQADHEL